MAKKKFFLIVDTETTQSDKVADLGAIVCDKQGIIHASMGVLVRDFYLDREAHPLFHIGDFLGGKANLPKRYANYDAMVERGDRMIASVTAINKWFARANAQFNPILTAYNLAFDASKARGSGIDLDMFDKRFCLWHSAMRKWAFSKAYRQFILDNHLFNPRTGHGNMSYTTKADYVAQFLLGPDLPPEPHTALEDARDYELPILKALVKNTSPQEYMNPEPFNWRELQVKDWFVPK